MFDVLALLPILIYLFIFGLGIYFVFKVIGFINEKTKLDRERNEKLNELISAVREKKKID